MGKQKNEAELKTLYSRYKWCARAEYNPAAETGNSIRFWTFANLCKNTFVI